MVTARATTDEAGLQLTDATSNGRPISNKELFSEKITRLSKRETTRAYRKTLLEILNAKDTYNNALLIGVDWLHNRLGYPLETEILVEQKKFLFILTAPHHIVRAISNNIQVEKRKPHDAENGRI